MTIIPQPEDLRSIATSAMDFELATMLPEAPLLMPTQVLERAQARESFRGRHAAIPISLGATTR